MNEPLLYYLVIVSSRYTILCGGTCGCYNERTGTSQSIQCVLLTGNKLGVICLYVILCNSPSQSIVPFRVITVHCHSIITLFCHTDADPGVQVSNLKYDMNINMLSWTPIPLFEARHFFNYTITATPSSSSTQKRRNSSTMIVPYSNCGDVCSVQPTLSPNTNYLVTVTITRSTNVGIPGNDDLINVM